VIHRTSSSPARANLSYNDFLWHLAPLVVLLAVIFVGLCRLLFRGAFRSDEDRIADVMSLRERDAISDPRLVALSRLDAGEVVKDVEWPTLVFFAGLFVMVGRW
jgi:Na+/H+ antiporter NhaD/arsenite permease-like protein